MRRLALVLSLCIAGITACRESPPPPPPAPKAQVPEPKPAPAPAPSASAPSTTAPQAVSVALITLGKAIGPDKKVTAPTEAFNKGDTIYAVVETTGAGDATLKAKWSYVKGDKMTVIDENTQTVIATGPATSEFHISKPDGWPPGEYQVEILVNDKPAGTKKFTVA